MKTKFSNIYSHSANLFNVLNSSFGHDLQPKFDEIFKYCIENGGLTELDFVRPKDQSYNPRPARVALILLNESKQLDQSLLISAMLACVDNCQDPLSIEAKQISSEIELKNYSRKAKLIALALHLDRIRHFHLSPHHKAQRKNIHLLTKKILDLAGSECQRVNHLITHWLQRDEQRN